MLGGGMTEKISVLVDGITVEATDVLRLVLRKPDGGEMPAFTPGAHVDLFLPNGITRQYSLLHDCRQQTHYEIAVHKTPDSRGGSAYIHSSLRAGAQLEISAPRNNFPLDTRHKALFIAGGIGITPILSMIHHSQAQGLDWRLFYLARAREFAAFRDSITLLGGNRVRFHFDAEAGGLFEFTKSSLGIEPGVHIYCCGPGPMMRAVESFSAAHAENPAHFEWFKRPENPIETSPNKEFTIKLSLSGRVLRVPKDKSILQVLEESGIDWPFSCREGMCRTCETQVIEGVPDHRDYVLSEAERGAGKSMMICVSRARTPFLTLDA
jgi:ferredoxin-NADP reductase